MIRALALAMLLSAEPAQALTNSAPLEAESSSARHAAVGGAALGEDQASAWMQAPAGLGGETRWSLSADEQVLALGLQRQVLQGIVPLGSLGSAGLGVAYTSFGDLESRDSSGLLVGSLSARRYAAMGGWGFPLTKSWDLGLSLAAYREEIGSAAFSGAQATGSARWSWSQDAFVSLAGGSESLGVGAGAPVPGLPSARAAVQLMQERGGALVPSLGGEWVRGPLALRAGWHGGLGESGSLGGLSAGLGMAWQGYRFDYAWLPLGALGDSHRLSFSYAPATKPAEEPLAVTATPESAPAATMVPQPDVAPPPLPEPVAPVPASVTAGPALELEFRLPESTADQAILADEKGDAAALALYQEAIKKDPADTRAWMGLGHLYYRKHDLDSALQCFDQVLRLNPTETALRDWVEQARAQKKALKP